MTLALRLRALMRRRGIRSQNQLARLSGVSQASIHRILASPPGYLPTRDVLAKLAKAVDASFYWLADGVVTPTAPATPTPVAPSHSHEAAEWTSLFLELSKEERATLVSLAKMLRARERGASALAFNSKVAMDAHRSLPARPGSSHHG